MAVIYGEVNGLWGKLVLHMGVLLLMLLTFEGLSFLGLRTCVTTRTDSDTIQNYAGIEDDEATSRSGPPDTTRQHLRARSSWRDAAWLSRAADPRGRTP